MNTKDKMKQTGKTYIYNNLGQMIEGRLVYFRSTDIEQQNYHRLLWSIPDEWLYLLSQDNQIIIKDKSTHKRGKIERIFVPVLNDFLNFIYLNKVLKNKNLKYQFQRMLEALTNDRSLYRKFYFWKGKIQHIKIIGFTIHVKKEENPLNQLVKSLSIKNSQS